MMAHAIISILTSIFLRDLFCAAAYRLTSFWTS